MHTVVENTPGYLPDADDPPVFATLDEARVYASDLLSSLLDSIYERGIAYGDVKAGARLPFEVQGSFAHGDLSVKVVDRTREHDLGRIIEIVEAPFAEKTS